MTTSQQTRRSEYIAGARAGVPLLVASVPFSIIFGAVAATGGLTPGAAAAMSAFVFAGSAQFVAAGLVATGAGTGIIILTTFIVNLRHSLYSATLAPHMRHLSQRWLALLGFLLTDEAFMVAIRRYNAPDLSPFKHWFYLGVASTMYVNWQLWTWVGIAAGQSIPNPRGWGLDFAFPLTFLGMLIPLLRGRAVIACVLAAGLASVMLRDLPHQLGLIVAALAGVLIGVVVDRLMPQAQAAPLAPEKVPTR
jgi:4-azaleucine resistance transporter AzlC